jgi:hypothetical protein
MLINVMRLAEYRHCDGAIADWGSSACHRAAKKTGGSGAEST